MSQSKGKSSSISMEEYELILAQNRRFRDQQSFFTDYISSLDEEKKECMQKVREYTQLNSDLMKVIGGENEAFETPGDSVVPDSPLTRLSKSNKLSLGELTKTFQSHSLREDSVSYSLNQDSVISESSGQSLDSGFNATVQQKLVEENSRLKNLLRDLSKRSGHSTLDFLKLHEYERVTTQLRQELNTLYKQNKELVSILQARTQNNLEYLTTKYTQLFKKAINQEKLLIVKQVLLESALQEVDKQQCVQFKSEEDTTGNITEIKILQREITQVENRAKEYLLQRDSALQKCDELSDMVETLMQGNAVTNPYPISTKELRQENESLRQQFSIVRQEGQRFGQTQGILHGQIEVLKEDLMKERDLRQEEKQKYENLIRGFENQIRKLSEEGLHLNKKWTEERTMNTKLSEQLEKVTRTMMQDVRVTSVPAVSMPFTKINTPILHPFSSHPSRIESRNPIKVDAPPGSPESIDPGYGGSIQEQGSQDLVCSRCWQEFKPSQQKEYEAHCKICTD